MVEKEAISDMYRVIKNVVILEFYGGCGLIKVSI
jgi:hypothetical protein